MYGYCYEKIDLGQKKVVSDRPGLLDFAFGLLNSVLNLPNLQVMFFEEFKLKKNCEIILLVNKLLGLVEMTFGLVNACFSLPEWQAVKNDFLCTLIKSEQRYCFTKS